MAYSYYASVTIQNGKVADDHADFPILVSGTFDGTGGEADLRTTPNGGKIQNTDASGGISGAYTVPADFVFSPNTDGSSEYDFEIEKYDAATGEIIAWVEIPTMDADADLVFYMVYGDSGVVNSQEDVNGTWNAGFVSVYHMAEGSAPLLDSTSNGHDTTGETGDPTFQQGGKVGYAVDYDGGDDYHAVADHADHDPGAEMTLEAWTYWNSNQDNVYPLQHDQSNYKWCFFYSNAGGTMSSIFRTAGGAYAPGFTDEGDGFYVGAWWYVAGTYDEALGANHAKHYQNGQLDQAINSDGNVISAGDEGVTIGSGAATSEFDGLIDEVRYSDVDRGAAWIETTFNTINDVSTFLSFGNQIGLGGAKIIFF